MYSVIRATNWLPLMNKGMTPEYITVCMTKQWLHSFQ